MGKRAGGGRGWARVGEGGTGEILEEPHFELFCGLLGHPRPDVLGGSFKTLCCLASSQKNPRVRKIRVRNSGAGNGCANFMHAWQECVLSAGKPVSIKFLVLGGGGYFGFFFWGGGSADFIFMGARIFLILSRKNRALLNGGTFFLCDKQMTRR